jgi:hypothetical protein
VELSQTEQSQTELSQTELSQTELTQAELDQVNARLEGRRRARAESRRQRQDLLAARGRLASADLGEQQRLATGLLTAAGTTLDDLDARRARNTQTARETLARHRRDLAEHATVPTPSPQQLQGRARRALGGPHLTTAVPFAFTTLDVAAGIFARTGTPGPDQQVSVQVQPPASMHNAAKVVLSSEAQPDIRFHVPGIWSVDLLWVFRMAVPDDVLLNCVTFVQATGVDTLYAAGWVFGDSFAQLDARSTLDMISVGPPPLNPVTALGGGDHDDWPQRRVHSDWWDIPRATGCHRLRQPVDPHRRRLQPGRGRQHRPDRGVRRTRPDRRRQRVLRRRLPRRPARDQCPGRVRLHLPQHPDRLIAGWADRVTGVDWPAPRF